MIDEAWKVECRARGGTPVVASPSEFGPHCRMPAIGGGFRYEKVDVSWMTRLKQGLELVGERVDIALGSAVEARDGVKQAFTQAGGVTGILGGILGIPRPLVLLALSGAVIYYASKVTKGFRSWE